MHILVPYRDRAEHLKKFIPYMQEYLPGAIIVVIEQMGERPFNRGKLLNIGYLETKPEYFIAHDVDHLPMLASYSPRPGVTQLVGSCIQVTDYLGGVTMFDKTSFEQIGGYNNSYFHRAEDNEIMFNIKRQGMAINRRFGKFNVLTHQRPEVEFDPALWKLAQKPREIQSQLSCCVYEVIKKVQEENTTHLYVSI